MKKTTRCPKCEGEDIWKVDPVSFPDPDSSNVVHTLPVGCGILDNPDAGLLESPTERAAIGRLVAYVCGDCGFTELYAADIEKLAKLRKSLEGTRVTRMKKKERPGGPFRG